MLDSLPLRNPNGDRKMDFIAFAFTVEAIVGPTRATTLWLEKGRWTGRPYRFIRSFWYETVFENNFGFSDNDKIYEHCKFGEWEIEDVDE